MIGDLYGEGEEINQLIIAFLEAGKVRQARALIKVSGFVEISSYVRECTLLMPFLYPCFFLYF